MTPADRLREALEAVCPVSDVSVVGVSASFTAGATATNTQLAAARDVLDGFDWSDEAHAAWQIRHDRQRAAVAVLGERGYFAVGVRAALSALWTAHNDLRELHGLARLTEAEVVQRVGLALAAGAGDPK